MQKKRPHSSAPKRPGRAGQLQQVRIIGGQWKRTPLAVLDAEGLRPTPDRVRETVFNWLSHVYDGAWDKLVCLDMFAGTGALGFEAASRGAARVVMIENKAPAVRQLEAVKEKLRAEQVSIVRADALVKARAWIAASGTPGEQQAPAFDIIFLDPPYHQDALASALPLCTGLLRAGGVVYVEAEMPLAESGADWLQGWEILRADQAGLVFYHLLRSRNTAEIQA